VTYSIVARDPETGELGVAVQSRAFGTGAAVAWARAGVGAVATQSFTNRGYGPRGLELLAAGTAPADALTQLVAEDDEREYRQVAFLAADGRTAAHVGEACIPELGAIPAENVSVQGNMLRSRDVVPAMAQAFAASQGTLAERLLDALDAAEVAGGDFRGRQASGLLVVPSEGTDKPWDDYVFNLRVDDHPEPLAELRRLHRLAEGYRRRNRIESGAAVGVEIVAARAAGLSEQDVGMAAVIAAAKAGDLDEAARRFRPYAEEHRGWLELLERYERLGVVPTGVVDRLSG